MCIYIYVLCIVRTKHKEGGGELEVNYFESEEIKCVCLFICDLKSIIVQLFFFSRTGNVSTVNARWNMRVYTLLSLYSTHACSRYSLFKKKYMRRKKGKNSVERK